MKSSGLASNLQPSGAKADALREEMEEAANRVEICRVLGPLLAEGGLGAPRLWGELQPLLSPCSASPLSLPKFSVVASGDAPQPNGTSPDPLSPFSASHWSWRVSHSLGTHPGRAQHWVHPALALLKTFLHLLCAGFISCHFQALRDLDPLSMG